jgi:hypothetical protein
MKKKKSPARSRFSCEYENGYDFKGVEFKKNGSPIASLWIDTREKSEEVIKFVRKIISEVRKG